MTKMQRYKQYTKMREQADAIHNRIGEYTQSKIQKAIEMVKHAIVKVCVLIICLSAYRSLYFNTTF